MIITSERNRFEKEVLRYPRILPRIFETDLKPNNLSFKNPSASNTLSDGALAIADKLKQQVIEIALRSHVESLNDNRNLGNVDVP
jgi:hypothetical protein